MQKERGDGCHTHASTQKGWGGARQEGSDSQTPSNNSADLWGSLDPTALHCSHLDSVKQFTTSNHAHQKTSKLNIPQDAIVSETLQKSNCYCYMCQRPVGVTTNTVSQLLQGLQWQRISIALIKGTQLPDVQGKLFICICLIINLEEPMEDI